MANRVDSEDEGIVEPTAIELLRRNYLEARNFVVNTSSNDDNDRHHHHHYRRNRHHHQQQQSENSDDSEVEQKPPQLPNSPNHPNFRPFQPAQSSSAMEWLESQAKETFNTNRNAAAVIVDPNFFSDIEAEYTALFTFMGYVTQLRAIFDAGRGDDVRPAGSKNSNRSRLGNNSVASRCDRYLPRFAQLYARCPRLCEEMQQICFVVYVHVFIKFHEAGFREQARAFLFRYSSSFKKPTQLPMLVSLNRVLATGELCKTLNNFKYGKLRTFVTEETLTLLKEWLVGEDKLAVLQIINTHIDFRILTYAQYVRYKSGKEYLRQETAENGEIGSSSSSSLTFTSNPMYRFLQPPKAQPARKSWQEVREQPSSPKPEKDDLMSKEDEQVETDEKKEPEKLATFSHEYLEVLNSIQSLREEPLLEPTLADVDIVQLSLTDSHITSVALTPRLDRLAAGREHDHSIALWDFSLADHLSYYSGRVLKHWSRVPVRRVSSEVDFRWIDYRAIANQETLKGSRRGGEDFEEEFDSDEEDSSGVHSRLSPTILRGHSAPVYDLAYYTPSSLLLSASGDGTVRAWDLHSGACLASYIGQASGPVWTVATAAEAVELGAQDLGRSQPLPNQYHTFISAGGPEGSAYLWDISRTVPLRLFGGGHRSDVNVAAFHPNGGYFATGSDDRTVVLWDANGAGSGTGAVRLFSGGHQGPVLSLAFSRCGKFLASGGADGTVRLWDIAEGGGGKGPVQTFAGGIVNGLPAGEVRGSPSSAFGSLSWSPGDRILAGTGAYSEGLYLWENPVAYRLTADKPACMRVSSARPSSQLASSFLSVDSSPHSGLFLPRRQTMLRLQFLSDRLVLAVSKPKLGGPVACTGPEADRLDSAEERARRAEKRRKRMVTTLTSAFVEKEDYSTAEESELLNARELLPPPSSLASALKQSPPHPSC